MDWVTVYKKTKLRTERGKQEEEGMKSRSTVQIFFKVDGSKAFPLDVSLRDTVRDVVRCIPSSACCSKRDVYVRYEGRVIRRSDELRSCGISDGSAVQVTNRMSCGGKHQDRENKAKKKPET